MMRSYKIVRISELRCSGAIDQIQQTCPEISALSYAEQQAIFFQYGFNYGDSLSWGLRSHGHEAHEIVIDADFLQKTWARENGVAYENGSARLTICLAQLRKLQPDVVYLQDIHLLPPDVIRQLKVLCPAIKVLVIFRGYPSCDQRLAQILSCADLLLVGSPTLLHKCQKFGLNPHLVYHFFDQRVLDKVTVNEKKHAFTFTGSSGYGYGLSHASRYLLLRDLLIKSPLEVWTDEPEEYRPDNLFHGMKYAVKKRLFKIFGSMARDSLAKMSKYNTFSKAVNNCIYEAWEMKEDGYALIVPPKPLIREFPNKCHKGLFGIEMYEKLAKSQISLNKHANCAQQMADNIRLFQATGMRSCLLTDACINTPDLFERDREIVEYKSQEECLEKLTYLLENVGVCQQIAVNGQKRTLRDHTVTVRCAQISEYIDRVISRKL